MKMLKSTAIFTILLAILCCFTACEELADNGKIYAFSHNGCEIVVNSDVAPILASLGSPLRSDALGTCGLRGDMDKIFDYSDFTIYTAQIDGKDYIDSLVLKSDLVSTKEGVSIGDQDAKITEKYGEPTERNDNVLTYDGSHMKLEFHLDEGKAVKSIVYRYTIEE